MRFTNRRWFNVSSPYRMVRIPGRNERHMLRPWNLFRTYSTDGHWWGFGLLQIGNRHLLLIGRTQGYPASEVWMAGLLFFDLKDVQRLRYQRRMARKAVQS